MFSFHPHQESRTGSGPWRRKTLVQGKHFRVFSISGSLDVRDYIHFTVCKAGVHRTQIRIRQVERSNCMHSSSAYTAILGCPNIILFYTNVLVVLAVVIVKLLITNQHSIFCPIEFRQFTALILLIQYHSSFLFFEVNPIYPYQFSFTHMKRFACTILLYQSILIV